MASFVSHTTVDGTDAYAPSRWWQAVLDYVEDPDDPNQPGHEECLVRSRDDEPARLLTLGATAVDDRRNPDGTGWVVLGEPEGNEFCILRSEAEVAATRGPGGGWSSGVRPG